MEYHTDTKEWSHIQDGMRVVWKSYFPEYPFNESEYGMKLFYSPYYTAESSNICVRSKKGETIGWLITLSYLQENDENFIAQNKPWLNKYCQIAIGKLIIHIIDEEPKLIEKQNDECCLSEVEFPNCHIFIYRLSQIPKDDMSNYLYEFYNEGFYSISKLSDVNDESIYYKSIYEKNIIEENPKESISISRPNVADELMKLLKNIYEKWLPFSYVNSFSRYIYLYQVVEYFMDVAFEESLYAHIKDYNEKRISKNDLREHIKSDSNEESKIEMVFQGISTTSTIVKDFCHNVDDFLEDIGVEFHGTSIGQHVYKMRNVLVHNMILAVDKEEKLDNVVECFEKLIVLKLNHGNSDAHNKHMVICDVSEKFKKNRKRMRHVYVQHKYGMKNE